MKKFNVLFMALLCASVVLVGCTDDDDENGEVPGNGQGAGNGGSGVVVLPKKVVRVIETETDTEDTEYRYTDTTLYAYDAEGRLSKKTRLQRGSEDVTNITYTSNKITLTSDNATETIELKDGRAIKSVDKESGVSYKEHTEMMYNYSGNYISKIIWNDIDTQDGKTITDTDESVFSIKDGNIVKMVYDYVDEDDADEITNVEISNIDNNMNIDFLYGGIAEFDGYHATLLCVTGDRFKKLPAKETYKEEGDEDHTATYAYVVNKDGYVTKITETSNSGSTDVYKITYED